MTKGKRFHLGCVASTALCMLMSACGSGGASGPGFGGGPAPGTGTATLSWEAPTANYDQSCLTNFSGYRVYFGTASGSYTYKKDVSLAEVSCTNSGTVDSCGPIQTCNTRISGLDPGTWYFAVTVINADGDSGIVSGEAATRVVAN